MLTKEQYLDSLSPDQLNNLDTKVSMANQFHPVDKARNAITNLVNGALAMRQQAQPERITRSGYNDWLNTLNPNDYQTVLNPQETQQYTDWAAKNNVPISKDYDMQGYWKNEVAPYEQLAQQGYTPEQIAGARQGLNQGNKQLADFIAQHNINKPTTTSEIALAKQGKLNPAVYDSETQHFTDKYKTPWHETFSNESQYATGDAAKYAGSWDGDKFNSPIKDDNASTVQDILAQVKQGYDNYSDTDRTGWNKVGKGVDIARAVLSNPALQGIVAGGIYGKVNGDWGKGAEYGLKYGLDKAKSNYYERQLGKKPGVFGNYDATDYKTKVTADINREKADAYKDNIISQINHRLQQEKISWADLAEKIRKNEVSEKLARDKYNLSVQQLKELIKYRYSQLGIQRQRLGIAQKNYNLSREKYEYSKKHPRQSSGKQVNPISLYNAEAKILNDKTLTPAQQQEELDRLHNYINNYQYGGSNLDGVFDKNGNLSLSSITPYASGDEDEYGNIDDDEYEGLGWG